MRVTTTMIIPMRMAIFFPDLSTSIPARGEKMIVASALGCEDVAHLGEARCEASSLKKRLRKGSIIVSPVL